MMVLDDNNGFSLEVLEDVVAALGVSCCCCGIGILLLILAKTKGSHGSNVVWNVLFLFLVPTTATKEDDWGATNYNKTVGWEAEDTKTSTADWGASTTEGDWGA